MENEVEIKEQEEVEEDDLWRASFDAVDVISIKCGPFSGNLKLRKITIQFNKSNSSSLSSSSSFSQFIEWFSFSFTASSCCSSVGNKSSSLKEQIKDLKVWNDFIWCTLETIIWWLNPPQNTLNLNGKLGEWKDGGGGWEMKILKE